VPLVQGALSRHHDVQMRVPVKDKSGQAGSAFPLCPSPTDCDVTRNMLWPFYDNPATSQIPAVFFICLCKVVDANAYSHYAMLREREI